MTVGRLLPVWRPALDKLVHQSRDVNRIRNPQQVCAHDVSAAPIRARIHCVQDQAAGPESLINEVNDELCQDDLAEFEEGYPVTDQPHRSHDTPACNPVFGMTSRDKPERRGEDHREPYGKERDQGNLKAEHRRRLRRSWS
jgi:hypothetical protein